MYVRSISPAGVSQRPQPTYAMAARSGPTKVQTHTPPVDSAVAPTPSMRIRPHVSSRSLDAIASLSPSGA